MITVVSLADLRLLRDLSSTGAALYGSHAHLFNHLTRNRDLRFTSSLLCYLELFSFITAQRSARASAARAPCGGRDA